MLPCQRIRIVRIAPIAERKKQSLLEALFGKIRDIIVTKSMKTHISER